MNPKHLALKNSFYLTSPSRSIRQFIMRGAEREYGKASLSNAMHDRAGVFFPLKSDFPT